MLRIMSIVASCTVACPTCHRELESRTSKRQKPYFVCELCGVQIFFRLREGINRLADSLTRSICGDDFVLCRSCQVAVRKSEKQISKGPLFGGQAGIHCPKCGELLLKADQIHST